MEIPIATPILKSAVLGLGLVFNPLIRAHTQTSKVLMMSGADRTSHSLKREVINKWKTDLAFGNFPMAIDEPNHRLFVGCRLPSKLVVLNTDSGDVVAKIDISGDPDDVFYDAKRHRIYAICGAGKIDVVEQKDPKTFKTSTKINTPEGARTGLFVSERDALFVAVPHRGSQQAEIRWYEIE